MVIKAVLEQYYTINDVEYKFVTGDSIGCEECDLYKTLKSRSECIFACNYGHMERCYKLAAVICPYCGTIITYPISKEGTICNKCDKTFKINYVK
jgi:hypothetical protein